MERFVKLKVIILTVCVKLDVLEETVLVLIVFSETEEMLNSIKCFVVMKMEHVFMLLALRDVLQLIHWIISSERLRLLLNNPISSLIRG